MIFAKIDKDKILYPFIAKQADYDKGIFPVIVNKPDSFRDEDEVWNDPEFEKYDDFILVSLTKRQKTPEEIELRDQKRLEEKTQFSEDINAVKERFIQIAKQMPSEELALVMKEINRKESK